MIKNQKSKIKNQKLVVAKLKYLRMPPRKVGLVAALIRGKSVLEARRILKFSPKGAARAVLKVLDSAVANAKNKGLAEGDLKVGIVRADPGPILKRGRPAARGRWHPILKRTTHVTVELEEIKNQKSKIKRKKT